MAAERFKDGRFTNYPSRTALARRSAGAHSDAMALWIGTIAAGSTIRDGLSASDDRRLPRREEIYAIIGTARALWVAPSGC